jgi:predicted dehydrogenase
MAQYITGSAITGVSGLTETFIKERPLVGTSQLLTATASDARGAVTVDDAALFTARFDNGALGSFEATRFANGRRNGLEIEVNGSLGSLRFDFQSMNELLVYDHTVDRSDAGWTRISTTQPEHPYMRAWWPPGHLIGYEHGFTHEFRDFVEAIVQDEEPLPSFADGLQVQRVLEAVERSAADASRWTTIPTGAPA